MKLTMVMGVALMGVTVCGLACESGDDGGGEALGGAGGAGVAEGGGSRVAPRIGAMGHGALATLPAGSGGSGSVGGAGADGGDGGAGGFAPGVCGTELTYGEQSLDQCMSANCCTEFDACIADTDCNACATGDGDGCEASALLQALNTCRQAECPTSICDTTLCMTNSYTHAVEFGCNQCATQYCCAEAHSCMQGGSPSEADACTDCLADPLAATCLVHGSVVQGGAVDLLECLADQCGC